MHIYDVDDADDDEYDRHESWASVFCYRPAKKEMAPDERQYSTSCMRKRKISKALS